MKRCGKCGAEKAVSEFYVSRKSRDGRFGSCRECTLKHQRERYLLVRDAKLAANAKWHAENPEKSREYAKRSRINDPERHRGYLRKYIASHRTERAEYAQKYFQEHGERLREYQRKRYARRPEVFAEYRHRWRAGQSDGRPSATQWLELLADCGDCCVCCLKHVDEIEMIYPGRRRALEMDHIIPVSLGGKSGMDNVQPLCPRCNNRKRKKSIDYRTRAVRSKYGPF